LAEQGARRFVALEGVSASGKSTVADLLAGMLPAKTLHVVPAPYSVTAAAVNEVARPLPQLAYYLSGLFYAADLVRDAVSESWMVTDRYAASVIANHAAVHGLRIRDVMGAAGAMLRYLPRPGLTVYLRTSPDEVRRRMRTKPDLTAADRHLLTEPGLLKRVLELYDTLLGADPDKTLWIETDGRAPGEIALQISEHLGSRA
jgi:dTMP kinase